MSAPRSIRLRLLTFALAVTFAALIVAGLALTALFGRHIERRIAQELDVHIAQIAAGLDISGGALRLAAEPANPRFAQAHGGLYWQVTDESGGPPLRSRSLWDFELDLPALEAAPGQGASAHIAGPGKQDLFLREKRLVLALGGGERPVRISVAETQDDARRLQSEFARDLVPGLAILGLVLIAGAWIQVSAGLRPLASIGRGLRDIRTGKARRLPGNVPGEIAPLVSEVNTLLDAQDVAMRRARDRAADLAHGLRTPLTALATDAERLRKTGTIEIATEVEALAQRMRRTVERELARSRARHLPGGDAVAVEDIAAAIGRTLARTPSGADIRIETETGGDARVTMDVDDLYDVLGNLMENAARAARAHMRVSAAREGAEVVICVEDDGPGLDPTAMERLATRGMRQDESGGAGLGLAIVSDVLTAYESAPEFFRSTLGGLGVRFRLPAPERGGAAEP